MTGAARDTDGTWEHFPHGSDIGVRGVGGTCETAFEQAALALTGVVTDLARVELARKTRIRVEAADEELLLYEWLNALVACMAIDGMLFGHFRVSLDAGTLEAEAWGEAVNVERHQPAVEIKGATFTELAVRQRDDGRWVAQCVVDV